MEKEIWKTVDDFPNYEVSNIGNVRNKKTGRILKSAVGSHGYPVVNLFKDGDKKQYNKCVHRLIAEGFLGKQDGLDVNHIDGNKKNNNLLNLEFCTRQKNVEHAIKNGLNNRKTTVKIVETGEQFDSMTDCAKHIQGDMKLISACIRGCQHTHRGYHFELVDIK